MTTSQLHKPIIIFFKWFQFEKITNKSIPFLIQTCKKETKNRGIKLIPVTKILIVFILLIDQWSFHQAIETE